MNQRRAACGIPEARARHRSAIAFLDAADHLANIGSDPDVIVTNAVHAGIAASDALCCFRLGERSTGQDHTAATRLLAQVDRDLANDFQRLLAVKTTAAYETRTISAVDAKGALRRARKLVGAATTALTDS